MSLGRIVLIGLGGLIVAGGISFGHSSYIILTRCDEAEAVELASFADGFGKKGNYAAPFCPKFSFTCKEMLCVIPNSQAPVRDDTGEVVSGLVASLSVVDDSGTVVHGWELTGEDFSRTWSVGQKHAGPFPAFKFSPVPPDDYEIQLSVQQPAATLVETPHRVVAKYELCGIERYPALVAGVISVVGFLVGGVMIVAALWPRRAVKSAKDEKSGEPEISR